AENARVVAAALPCPLLLENVPHLVPLPGDLDPPAFLARVAERSGCRLLLDLADIYVDARNGGEDPRAYLERFPLHRVAALRVAGVHEEGGIAVPRALSAVPEGVWRLAVDVLAKVPVQALLVDQDYSLEREVVTRELLHARRLWEALRPTRGQEEAAA
ncbi:MAG TPA: DUF692 family protein, partial [Candidatus Thermoplasmatota archaeon]|nr:DUF692 family protein [Candidatus Thermoplasmatota archaeon]